MLSLGTGCSIGNPACGDATGRARGVWGKGADDGERFDRGCDSDAYRYVCEPG